MPYTPNPDWDTPIFSGDLTGSWHTCDLSDIIDSEGRYLVFLMVTQVVGCPSDPNIIGARPTDSSLSFRNTVTCPSGAACTGLYYIGDQSIISQITDSVSSIQLRSDRTQTVAVRLLGWLPWTSDDSELFPSGEFPSTWTDLDLSSFITRAGKNFVEIVPVRADVNQCIYGIRRKGDTLDMFDSAYTTGGENTLGSFSSGVAASLFMSTDENKIIQHRQKSTGGLTGTLRFFGYSPYWTPIEEIAFGPAPHPGGSGVWTDIDLSELVGERSVVVLLKTTRVDPIADVYSIFTPKGFITNHTTEGSKGASGTYDRGAGFGSYALVPTDENGVISWLCNAASIKAN